MPKTDGQTSIICFPPPSPLQFAFKKENSYLSHFSCRGRFVLCTMLPRGPYAESCDFNKFPIHDVLKQVLRWISLPPSSSASGNTDSCAAAAGGAGGNDGGGAAAAAVLELGSGTGQHALYFSSMFSSSVLSRWQTTDLASELEGIKLNFAYACEEEHKQQQAQKTLASEEASQSSSSFRCPPSPLELSFVSEPEVWSRCCSARLDGVEGSLSQQRRLYDIVFTANTFHIAPWEACRVCISRLPLVVRPGGFFVVYGPFNYDGKYTSESNARFDRWLKTHKSEQSAIRSFEDVSSALNDVQFALKEDFAMPENNRCLVFQRRC